MANLPIRARLQWLVLALAVPFMIYVFVTFTRQSSDERKHAGAQMVAEARLTAARLDDRIGDVRQVLRLLTAVAEVGNGGAASNGELLRSLSGHVPDDIESLGIWSADGRLVGSWSRGDSPSDLFDQHRRFFQDALQAGDLSVEAPLPVKSQGAIVGLFGLPIERDHQRVGIVAATVRLNPLQSLVVSHGNLPPEAVVTVLDERGVVLARSLDPDKWVGHRLDSVAVNSVAATRSRQREGVRLGPSADGVERVAGFTTARRVPWVVYVGMPSEIALAPLRERSLGNLSAAGVLMIVGLLMATWIGRGIAAPLRNLREYAAAIGAGRHDEACEVREGGEIGDLAHTLKQMSQAIELQTAALTSSQKQMRDIADNMPGLISYLNSEHRFEFANQRYADWLGVDPGWLIGKSLHDLYGADVYAQIRLHLHAALGGARVVYERELATVGGPRTVEVTMVPDLRADDAAPRGIYVLMSDVTEHRRAQLERTVSEERLSMALDASNLGLFDWDLQAGTTYHSPRAITMWRHVQSDTSSSSPSPRALLAAVHDDDQQRIVKAVADAIAGTADHFDVDFRVPAAGCHYTWLRVRGRVVARDANGRSQRLSGTYVDVTARKEAEERLVYLAEYDSLTGLPNRGHFLKRLTDGLGRKPVERATMALLFLDIDHFKRINDTLGHNAGDEALGSFARSLRAVVGDEGVVARWAGDEFVVMVSGCDDERGAQALARRILVQTRRFLTAELTVSASIGIAMFDPNDIDPQAVIERADRALYDAKCGGRNRYAMARRAIPSAAALVTA